MKRKRRSRGASVTAADAAKQLGRLGGKAAFINSHLMIVGVLRKRLLQ